MMMRRMLQIVNTVTRDVRGSRKVSETISSTVSTDFVGISNVLVVYKLKCDHTVMPGMYQEPDYCFFTYHLPIRSNGSITPLTLR